MIDRVGGPPVLSSPRIVGACLILSLFLLNHHAHAQVATSITGNTVTGNVSTQVVLPPPGENIYGIQGGYTAGSNLFHSFSQFNVGAGDVAQFQTSNLTPTTSIYNILGRVNGQQSPSQIFGTIDSVTYYPSANLFLMNPAGFLFGPNATINVGGMVAFTSADYLRLTDGVRFNAAPDVAADALLSTAPVAAYGFLGSDPGAITVQGSQLTVAEGTGISLVGGDITIGGSLKAPGGKIAIASVASPGEAPMTDSGTVELFDAAGQPLFPALGNIVIAPDSQVDVSGNAAGTISIRGGKLTVSDSQLLAVTRDANAAPVGIDIKVSGDANFLGGQLGQSYMMTWSEGSGNAGDVIIQSKNYLQKGDMTRPIRVGSTTFGAGEGGDVTIKASESITVEGSYTELGSGVEGGGTGKGGDVLIEAPLVNVQGGGIFNRAPGAGPGGTLTIKADDVIVTIRLDIDLESVGRVDTRTYGPGAGGDLIISARNSVLVTDTGLVLADTLGTDPNAGKGGNIIITAPRIEVLSGWIDAGTYGPGQGGSVTLRASSAITVDFFGTVVSQTLSTNPSAGAGGHVLLEAPIINVRRGSRIGADSAGPGHAGDVTLIGTEQVSISGIGTAYIYSGDSSYPIFENGTRYVIDGTTSKTWPFGYELPKDTTVTTEQLPARIHTFSQGSGSGGDVTIRTPQLLLSDQAFITAENTGDGPAGHVLFQVGTLTTRTGASISTATTGIGAAGSIVTQGLGGPGTLPTEVTMVDSSIRTSASGTGAGGNILIGAAGSTPLTLTDTTLSASVHDKPAGAASDQGLANIALAGPTVRITGGRLIADTTGTRQGGDILIRADQNAHLTHANVSVKSTGPANAGSILIEGGRTVEMDRTQVSAEAAQASGGNITLVANDSIQLVDSMISTSVLGGSGGGGNIAIDPQYVLLQNSQILAQAVQGPGGNISITTNLLLPDANSTISASSQTGVNGTITIQSPNAPAGGKIVPLSQKPLIATSLLTQRCAALAEGNFSSFMMAGRDSLPAEPSSWLASPLALASEFSGTIAGNTTRMNEPPEDAPLLSLRQIAPPGFLTQHFAADSSDGCTS